MKAISFEGKDGWTLCFKKQKETENLLHIIRNVLFKGSSLLMWNKNIMRYTEKDPKIWMVQERKLEPKLFLSAIFS